MATLAGIHLNVSGRRVRDNEVLGLPLEFLEVFDATRNLQLARLAALHRAWRRPDTRSSGTSPKIVFTCFAAGKTAMPLRPIRARRWRRRRRTGPESCAASSADPRIRALFEPIVARRLTITPGHKRRHPEFRRSAE